MVLYNSLIGISFPKYGIAIPSLDSRKTRTIEALLEHPVLGPMRDLWYRQDIPSVMGREDLERVHTPEYMASLYDGRLEEKLIAAYELVDSLGYRNRYDPDSAEFPLTGLREEVLRILSGTYRNVEIALEEGFSYFLGGGMHHAHPGFGHGFCLVNDIAAAAARIRHEGRAKRIWIIDTDAHRGDGTAEIFSGTEEVKTLSIHMARGWPLDGDEYRPDGSLNPAWIPGDMDIPIKAGEEHTYIIRLMDGLAELERQGLPDLALVVAGVDPYEKDELPSTAPLALTKEKMFLRDKLLYEFLRERRIPSAWLAAGGYGASSWEIHTAFLEWVLLNRLKK